MGNILYKYLDINGAIMMLHHRSLMYANGHYKIFCVNGKYGIQV